jgi:hypothetical protein
VSEPLTKPIQPWLDPDPIKRSWIERFGLVAAVFALIALSVLTASWSLRVPPAEPIVLPVAGAEPVPVQPVAPAIAQVEKRPAAAGPEEGEPADAEVTSAPGTRKAKSAGAGELAAASKTKEAAHEKASKGADSVAEPATPALPAGASGLADGAGGVLLRYNTDEREWMRLTGPTPIARSDRLLCLSPFRAKLTLGKIPIELVAETEVRILSQPSDKVPALELIQGRLLVRNSPTGSLKVGFADRNATVELTPTVGVVLERTARREYGQAIGRAPSLYAYCTQGELALSAGTKQESLTASDVVVIDTAGAITRMAIDSPSWATETEPSPLEVKLRDQFIRVFHPGRPVLTEIVAASEDDNTDIRQLSIRALRSLGDLSLLMPMLSRAGDPVSRKGALAAIRSYMALGPETASRVRAQLAEEFGDDTASFVEKMLVGYTAD